ncbi:MAG: hypothetical protein RSF40_01575 [Oscillospiraceae bacterium]
MRKIDSYLAVQCYRYTPEQFQAFRVVGFSNGNRNIPIYEKINLSDNDIRTCGYAYCTKGRDAAIAELKRVIRKMERQPKLYVTIGFRSKVYPKQYRFTQDIRCLPNDLKEKLRVYKEFKEFVLSQNCMFGDYTEATLDGHYKPTNIKTKYDELDITKPVMVWIKIKWA